MLGFKTECSLPPDGVNFVSAPDVRGTLEILWSCLVTLFLCTWTIQHLNVPEQSDTHDKRIQGMRRGCRRLRNRVKWMLITFFCPEYLVGQAWTDRLSARIHTGALHDLAKDDNVVWSLVHTYLANMGGFAIVFPAELTEEVSSSQCNPSQESQLHLLCEGSHPEADVSLLTPQVEEYIQQTLRARSTRGRSSRDNWLFDQVTSLHDIGGGQWRPDPAHLRNLDAAITHINSARFPSVLDQERYYHDPSSWYSNLLALQGSVWRLDACQLLYARQLGVIDKLPLLTLDEIDDRNKGDALIKFITVAQVIWFILQLLARVLRPGNALAVSQLEIFTLAFTACTVVTYSLQWHKPQDVRTPISITAKKRVGPLEMSRLAIRGPGGFFFNRWHYVLSEFGLPCVAANSNRSMVVFLLPSVLGSMLFGGIHCAAWVLDYPSSIEQTLWRVTALITISTGPAGWVLGKLFEIAAGASYVSVKFAKAHDLMVNSLTVVYCIARLYLTVEAFRTLAFLGPRTFISVWAANLPSLS